MGPHPAGSGRLGGTNWLHLQPVPGNSSLSREGWDLKNKQRERVVRVVGPCVPEDSPQQVVLENPWIWPLSQKLTLPSLRSKQKYIQIIAMCVKQFNMSQTPVLHALATALTFLSPLL